VERDIYVKAALFTDIAGNKLNEMQFVAIPVRLLESFIIALITSTKNWTD